MGFWWVLVLTQPSSGVADAHQRLVLMEWKMGTSCVGQSSADPLLPDRPRRSCLRPPNPTPCCVREDGHSWEQKEAASSSRSTLNSS
jgi:hypothetical protein